jgi:hypothetical protein
MTWLRRLLASAVIDERHPPKGVGWWRTTVDGKPGWARYDGLYASWRPDSEERR